MKNKLAKWMNGVFGLDLLDIELSEIVKEEKEELREEEKIKDVLKKKKEIIGRLSAGLANVTEISQLYTAKNMLKLIFGKQGLLKLNERLKNLDEKLKGENKKELEDLKKEKGGLRKEGLDELFGIERRIYDVHEQMRGLFELFEGRLREENRILRDKSTFGRMMQNTMESITRLNDLNQIIFDVRKDLAEHPHHFLKDIWQGKIVRKVDELNELSMSAKERKELLTHIRRHLINPIRSKYKEEAKWVEVLERKLEQHEHTKKAHEWETRLERAIWDLSEEIRRERIVQQHMEKALEMIGKEMERFKDLLEAQKDERLAA